MEHLDGANAAFGKLNLPNAAFAHMLVVGAGTMGSQIGMLCALSGHPMGPFELMDLNGIDIGYHAGLARHAVTGSPRDLPSRTVSELVERGELGRKTGKGFYTYDAGGNRT